MSLHRVLQLGALGVALLVCSPPARAEAKPEDKRAEVRSRMRGLIGKLLRKDVGLDEQKATAVEKVFERFQPERRKLRAELRAQRKQLRELLAQNSDDQQAYQAALTRVRQTRKRLRDLHERELDAALLVLTPKEQAKFLEAMRRLQRRLNAALDGYRGKRDD